MRTYTFILIFVLVSNSGFSQEKLMKYLPILFDTIKVDAKYNRKRLEIKDTLLSDSLRIGFRVALEFKYSLGNVIKRVTIRSVRLVYLDVQSLSTKKQWSIDLLGKAKWSRYQRDIWNRYSKILNYWYWNQPYEKMIDRKAYGKKAYFGGVLYVVPR
ncbi:hypothetical protein [uncultured Bacteroides sp.]|uniref:hypothetical protein n=1 Tax=uncultured Bacteroides sp. TaxID=162156 RepID=UPI002AA6DF8A|nr:hypothetical protein [uncultured Bacteroides sp.]